MPSPMNRLIDQLEADAISRQQQQEAFFAQFQSPSAGTPQSFTAGVDTTHRDVPFSKRKGLLERQQEKLKGFNDRAGLGEHDLSDDFMQSAGPDGQMYEDHMGNKIINDYTQDELDEIIQYAQQEYGLREQDGRYFQRAEDGGFALDENTGRIAPGDGGGWKEYDGYQGDYSTLYKYGTKDGNIKWGMASGVNPNARYDETWLRENNAYVGETGVNVQDLRESYLLPKRMTEVLEGLIHGSEENLQRRLYRRDLDNLAAYDAAKASFGTGLTEAYSPRDPNRERQQSRENLLEEFRERFNPQGRQDFRDTVVFDRDYFREQRLRREAEEGLGVLGRAWNMQATAATTLIGEVLYHPIGWVGRATGAWDFGDREKRDKDLQELFGVNPYVMENSWEGVKGHATNLYEKWQKEGRIDAGEALGGIFAAATALPELLGASVGYMVSFFGPRGWVAGATTVGKSIKHANKMVKAGEWTKEAAQLYIKNEKAVETGLEAIRRHSGAVAAFSAMTGNQMEMDIEAFKANNNGEISVADIARMLPIAAAHVAIDLEAKAFLFKDIKRLTSLRTVLQDTVKKDLAGATASEYGRVMRTFLKGMKEVGQVAGHVGVEGTQEYILSMMETFNAQYATEKYGTEVAKILGSEFAQIEGWTSAFLGAGMAGPTAVMGRAKRAVTNSEQVRNYFTSRRISSRDDAPGGEIPADQMTEDELTVSRNRATELARDLYAAESEGIANENYMQTFWNYQSLLSLRPVFDSLPADQQEAVDRHIQYFGDLLERLITDGTVNISELDMDAVDVGGSPSETVENIQRIRGEVFQGVDPETVNANLGIYQTQAEVEAEIGVSSLQDLLAAQAEAGDQAKASMVGRGSRTADQAQLTRAQQLAEQGRPMIEIWGETSWYQEGDGQWRAELSDREAQLTESANQTFDTGEFATPLPKGKRVNFKELTGGIPLSEFLAHDSLFEAYPELRDVQVHMNKVPTDVGAMGGVNLNTNQIYIEAPTKSEAIGVALHEVQHIIQRREGHSEGTSVNAPLAEESAVYTGRDAYTRNTGEIEARNTQFRATELHEKYAHTAPWVTADQFSEVTSRNAKGELVLHRPTRTEETSSVGKPATAKRVDALEQELADFGHRILNYALRNYAQNPTRVIADNADGTVSRLGKLEQLHSALKDSFYAQRHHDIKNLAEEFDLPTPALNEWNRRIDELNALDKEQGVKPSDVRFSAEDGVVQAVTFRGKTYMIADNIPAGRARSVMLHETGVHLAQIDKRLRGHYRKFVDALSRMERSPDETTRKVIEAAKQRTTDALGERENAESKALWDEEFVAYTVEEAVAAGVRPKADGTPIERFLDAVMNFFKTALTLVYKSEDAQELADSLTIQDVVTLAHGFAVEQMQRPLESTEAADRTEVQVAEELEVDMGELDSTAAETTDAFNDDLEVTETERSEETEATEAEESTEDVIDESDDVVLRDVVSRGLEGLDEGAERTAARETGEEVSVEEAAEPEPVVELSEQARKAKERLEKRIERGRKSGEEDVLEVVARIKKPEYITNEEWAQIRKDLGMSAAEAEKAPKGKKKLVWQDKSETPKKKEPKWKDVSETQEAAAEQLLSEPEAARLIDHLDEVLAKSQKTEETDGKASSTRRPRKRKEMSGEQKARAREALMASFLEFLGERAADGKIPEATVQAAEILGERYEIPKSRVRDMVKNYTTVREESNLDQRGVVTRFNRLRLLFSSDNPTKALVQKEYDELREWLHTTEESIEQLERTITQAEAEVAKRNAAKTGGKEKKVVSEYHTHPLSKGKGRPFVISVLRHEKSGKWFATGGIAEARKRIQEKRDTIQSITQVMEFVHQNGMEYLDPNTVNTDGGFQFAVPTRGMTDAVKKNIKGERNYVQKAMELLGEATGTTPVVNKLILGNKRASRWRTTGTRARMNSTITNRATTHNEAYSADDVVMVHELGSFKVGKGNKRLSDLHRKDNIAAKEIAAAMEAGATIILESTVQVKNDLKGREAKKDGYTRFTGINLKNFMLSKGYIAIDVEGPGENVFIPKTKLGEERLKKLAEAAKERTKAESDRKKDLAKLLKAHNLVRAMEDFGYNPENIDLATAKERLAELRKETGDKYFTAKSLRALQREQAEILATRTVDEVAASDRVEAPEIPTAEEAGLTEAEVEALEEFSDVDTESTGEASLDIDLSEGAVTARTEDNLDSFLERNVKEEQTEILDLLRATDATGEAIQLSDKAAEHIARLRYEKLLDTRAQGSSLLAVWAQSAKERLDRSALYTKLKDAVKNIYGEDLLYSRRVPKGKKDNRPDGSFLVGDEARAILENAVGRGRQLEGVWVRGYHQSGNNPPIHYSGWQWDASKFKVGETVRVEMNSYDKTASGNILRKPMDMVVTSVDRHVLDPTALVEVSEVTPLNTLPVDELPLIFAKLSDSVNKAFVQSIEALNEAEKKVMKRGDRATEGNIFNIVDSPARTLVFDREGNIHPAMAAAMAMAIGEMIRTDRAALTRGFKTDEEIARMFNVRPEEVTPQMRKHVQEFGTFRKSIARTLGKGTLAALGIRKRSEVSDLSRGQYDSLEVDLGNMVVETAITMGIITKKEAKSNDLAQLYMDGEVHEQEAVTHFLHLNKEKSKTKGEPDVDAPAVADYLKEFTEADELMPDATSRQKGPRIGTTFNQRQIEAAQGRIKNDVTRGAVPAEAKKAIENFMKTPFKMDLKIVGDLVERVKDADTRQRYLEFLGHIPLDNKDPRYARLLFEEKQKQEGKNRDIEKSLEELEKLYEILKDKDPNNPEDMYMYFEYFYALNHRYHMDSNTVNPQTNKEHRFLVQPAALEMDYTFNREKGNTFEYSYKDKDGKTQKIDTSLFVRAALAQAFGMGIDKANTREIIALGNALLSLKHEEVLALREALFNVGSESRDVLVVHAPNHDGVMTKYDLKPDHFAHGLQALQFLEDYTNPEGLEGNTIRSSLTFEMDALTSGFANKTQQFGSLDNLTEHLRRVGVLNKAHEVNQTLVEENGVMRSLGEILNDPMFPEYGTSDMLADPGVGLDSYQNLGDTSIRAIPELVAQNFTKGSAADKHFRALSSLFPGAKEALDHRDSGSTGEFQFTITKAIRELFKPGFMIFNYAASIERIKINLGTEIATGALAEIAAADLSDPDNAHIRPAVEALLPNLNLREGRNKLTKIKTVEELQELLRTEESRNIVVSLQTAPKKKGKTPSKNASLVEYISEQLIIPTYGEAVETTFQEQFKTFIQIQDNMNDIFRSAYQVFNTVLIDRVDQYRKDNPDRPVSENVIVEIIKDLEKAFPLIAGPLSEELSEGLKIYDTDTRTPHNTMATRDGVQTRREPGRDSTAKTAKVNPLLRNIISAANSGAVLPLHALDSAQIGLMANRMTEAYLNMIRPELEGAGIIPVHDAIFVPLAFADHFAFEYNKVTYELNSTYDIFKEVVDLSERINTILKGEDPDIQVDTRDITRVQNLSSFDRKDRRTREENVRALKTAYVSAAEAVTEAEKKKENTTGLIERRDRAKLAWEEASAEISFEREFETLRSNADFIYNEHVKPSRENDIYPEGTNIGLMVGMRGSMYEVGSNATTPNQDYLAYLNDNGFYRSTNVRLDEAVRLETAKRDQSKKTGWKDNVTDNTAEGTYNVGSLMRLKPANLLAKTHISDIEVLRNGELDGARSEVSQRIIAEDIETGQPIETLETYKAMDSRIEEPFRVGETVMVTAPHMTSESVGVKPNKEGNYRELFPSERAVLETAWENTVERAREAVNAHAILVFPAAVAESAEMTNNGEAYVYQQLQSSYGEQLTGQVVTLDGHDILLVSKLRPTEAESATIAAEPAEVAEAPQPAAKESRTPKEKESAEKVEVSTDLLKKFQRTAGTENEVLTTEDIADIVEGANKKC